LQGLRALVAHELAHYVQFREDWNIGGSESLFEHELEPYQKEYDELSAKRETLDPNTAEYEKVNNRLNEISEILHDPDLQPHAKYKRLAGETEARNVMRRLRWDTDGTRRQRTPFSESEDTPRDKQIPRRIRYMKSPQGTILGFVQPQPDGSFKVWIDPKTTDAETPIHELGGHIFLPLLKESNPEFYQKGVDLIQNTPYLANAKKLGLEGDAAVEEALAQAIGEKGKQLSESQRPGFLEWLKGMWERTAKALKLNVPIQNLTLGEFTDLVAGSVLEGEALGKMKPNPTQPEGGVNIVPPLWKGRQRSPNPPSPTIRQHGTR